MVLSFVPSTREGEPLTIEEAAATARIVEQLNGTHRLLLHGRVNPNQRGDLEGMDELAARYKISAWKTYTQWGPDGASGFFMDDEPGIRLIEKARKLGIRNIAIHKGLAFGPKSYEHSTCVDIGRVAKRYPDVNFLIYHSGFVANKTEGAYDAKRTEGIDALVTSLLENSVKPGSNVYAELGSTWRLAMRDPDTAAHTIGKLVKYCGENNVLWGTDSIWYGSPQDQIQAFRTFQIAPELRDKHGYTESPGATCKNFRIKCAEDLSGGPRRDQETRAARQGGAATAGISRASRPGVCHLRAEDTARVFESAQLGLADLLLRRRTDYPCLHRRPARRPDYRETQ